MPLNSKEKQDFIKSFIAHFFSDKLHPKHFASNLSSALNDNNLLAEVEKHWAEKNKEIEKKVYQEFGSNASKEIKQIAEQKSKKFDTYYRLSRTFDNITEADVRNWLPVDKLLYNQDIFHKRLRGLDLANIDSTVEKRIIQSLEKEATALNRQEVLLYYSLIKANKLSVDKTQAKFKRRTEESKFFKAIASGLLGLIYPKRISSADLLEINEGAKIERESMRDTLVDKIHNQKFHAYPYLIFFGIDKTYDLYNQFIQIAALTKYFGDDPEKIVNYTIFYILFKSASENFLKISNIQPTTMNFLNGKAGPFSAEGNGMIRLLDTFFYALCTQIYEINKTYQKAGNDKKAKIYKLYSAEDRLRMIVQNSLSIGYKVIQRMKLDQQKLLQTVTHYIEKQKKFLTKESIFASVYDFENMVFTV